MSIRFLPVRLRNAKGTDTTLDLAHEFTCKVEAFRTQCTPAHTHAVHSSAPVQGMDSDKKAVSNRGK